MADTQSLEGIEVLAGMSEAERAKLAKRCRWASFAHHETIIDRDSDTSDVYFVVQGRVRVVNFSYSGREVSYDDIEAGGFFGELAAIDGAPRSANVVALAPTTVAMVSPDVFRELLHTSPEFAVTIIERLVQIIRGSTDRIMNLSTRDAHGRIYAELLRTALAHAGGGHRAVIKPAPVHSDIASRVGTTRETVARTLSELSKRGIVRREGKALHVLDIEQLEELAEFGDE